MLPEGILYLKIRAFYENTYKVVTRELRKVEERYQVSLQEANTNKPKQLFSQYLDSRITYAIIKGKEGMRKLQEHPLKGLLLDLRDNPGGLLEQAIKVASIFIHKGRIVGFSSRKYPQQEAYDAENVSFKLNKQIPIIVFIDKKTAFCC